MSGTSTSAESNPEASLGRMAHDLKNLMGIVLGFTEMLLHDLGPDDERREELLEIQKAGQAAVTLALQMMEMARSREEK